MAKGQKKPTRRDILEDFANTQFRSGGHDWGEHGEGPNVRDGRKSRYPKSRFAPKGEIWKPLIEGNGEHKG